MSGAPLGYLLKVPLNLVDFLVAAAAHVYLGERSVEAEQLWPQEQQVLYVGPEHVVCLKKAQALLGFA